MPLSGKKRRPASAKAKRRAQGKKALKLVSGNTIQIRGNHLAKLRTDPDFATLVRIGRAMNALAFCRDVLLPIKNTGKPIDIRNAHRAVLMLAGYLYETLLLLQNLEPRYRDNSAFATARTLVVDKSRWRVVEKLRNRSGFHLDKDDKLTTKTLAGLRSDKNYPLYSFEDINNRTLGTYYFNLADEIDSAYFAKELAEGIKSSKSINGILWNAMNSLIVDSAKALKEFHNSLRDKFGL